MVKTLNPLTDCKPINWMITKGHVINGAICFRGNIPAHMGDKARAWFAEKGVTPRGSNSWSNVGVREGKYFISLRYGCYIGTENHVTLWATPIEEEPEPEAAVPEQTITCAVCGAKGVECPCLPLDLYTKIVADRKWRELRDGDETENPRTQDYIDRAWLLWANAPRPGDQHYIPF